MSEEMKMVRLKIATQIMASFCAMPDKGESHIDVVRWAFQIADELILQGGYK